MAVAILAGCGAHERRTTPPRPTLPRALAQRLAAQSDAIARRLDERDDCGALAAAQRLQRDTIAAVNRGAVAASLQEPLMSAATRLSSRIRCTPPPASPRPATTADKGEHGHGKKHGHEKKGHD